MSVTGTGTSIVIPASQLTAGGVYEFSVAAQNATATGPQSALSNPVTIVINTSGGGTTNTVPGAPASATASGGVGQITVSWTAPASNGGAAVTSYTVAYTGQAAGSLSASGTSTTITGLAAGNYAVTVAATNSVGTGTAASAGTVTVTGATVVVNPPTALITAASGTSGVLTWTAPTGTTVTSYTVGRDGVDSTGAGAYTTSVPAGQTSFMFQNLTPGTTYNLSVATVTAAGTSTTVAKPLTVPNPNPTPPATATNLLPAGVAALGIDPGSYVKGTNNATTLAAGTGAPAVTGSAVLNATTAATGVAYWIPPVVVGNMAKVTAGTTYTGLIYYNPNKAGLTASAQIMWYTSSLTLISYSKGAVTSIPQATWTGLRVTASAPTNAAYAFLQMTVDVSVAAAVIQVSNVELAAGSSISTWTPGITPVLPGAPTINTVTPGAGAATVAFTAPTTGGTPTSYIVTATSA